MGNGNVIPERYTVKALRLQVGMAQEELGVSAGYFRCTCRVFEDSERPLSEEDRKAMVAMLKVLFATNVEYSRIVREWRELYALSLSEAAGHLGVSRATVHKVERGHIKRLPRRSTREKLDRFFGQWSHA